MRSTVLQSIRESGERIAIVDGSRLWTYRDLLIASMAMRDALLAGRDDLGEARVAFLVPARFEYVATLLGLCPSL